VSNLGEVLTVPNRGLGAFLVVHHEIDGEARPVRPFGIEWRGGIADEISVMSAIHCRTFQTCRGLEFVARVSEQLELAAKMLLPAFCSACRYHCQHWRKIIGAKSPDCGKM
jgi:hypothetical protein